jgi:riboflavin kinase / FMN adenylyltransferase
VTAGVIEWEAGAVELGPAVAAVGVFDGVHLGHQALIRTAVERAAQAEAASLVVTFDRDPDQVVTPDSAAPQLLTLEDKLHYLGELGTETILVVPFCRRIADTAPDRFVSDVLLDAFDPVSLVVGADFRFGCRASGTVETLERFGRQHGFEVVACCLVEVDDKPVTSTRIRALVAEGEVASAARLLGRPHRVRGRVVRGRSVGRGLGFPTANVTPLKYSAVPRDGVYAGRVVHDGESHMAGISVGTPPSFPDARDYLEAHLVDFEGDLYGREVAVEFVDRIRDQREFENTEDLAHAIRDDILKAIRVLDGGVR